MPKAIKKTTDRQRKEKFTNEELTMLTETLAVNADVVFANDMRRETLICRKAIWAEVALKVSAVGTTTRTVRDCRTRWDDLRLQVRSLLSANRNMATGGGADSPIKLKEWVETCANMIGVESIEGVGSMEHGVATTSDGGSHTDSEELGTATLAPPATNRPRPQDTGDTPTTSKGKGRRVPMQRAKHRLSDTATIPLSTPATTAPPSEVNPPTTDSSHGGPTLCCHKFHRRSLVQILDEELTLPRMLNRFPSGVAQLQDGDGKNRSDVFRRNADPGYRWIEISERAWL
ncbi:nuclear apoptosis-inducing factor 1-like [Ambystoma mexicanum]|uniref:nuclear apoptosis-inducing factor 1-like n=1 Tax=Ambystoma mexicanum TaxID=8296 RepID=UPI0037E86064